MIKKFKIANKKDKKYINFQANKMLNFILICNSIKSNNLMILF